MSERAPEQEKYIDPRDEMMKGALAELAKQQGQKISNENETRDPRDVAVANNPALKAEMDRLLAEAARRGEQPNEKVKPIEAGGGQGFYSFADELIEKAQKTDVTAEFNGAVFTVPKGMSNSGEIMEIWNKVFTKRNEELRKKQAEIQASKSEAQLRDEQDPRDKMMKDALDGFANQQNQKKPQSEAEKIDEQLGKPMSRGEREEAIENNPALKNMMEEMNAVGEINILKTQMESFTKQAESLRKNVRLIKESKKVLGMPESGADEETEKKENQIKDLEDKLSKYPGYIKEATDRLENLKKAEADRLEKLKK